ncbi:MAG: transporter substrate-binding domain-containing protein [Propionibacteriaceae bacterium]|jgi:ABC-type amino acid transport substrate-binding protein|nr:transporter substrate-binding domain-containing protein [Propionibacteriaceae bacterium]
MRKKITAVIFGSLCLALLATACSSDDPKSGDTTTTTSTPPAGPALKVVGSPFTTELYGVGLPKDSPYCEQVNTAIKEMITDGTWKAKLDAEMAGVLYTPNAEKNAPANLANEVCDNTGDAPLVTAGRLTIGIKFDQPKLGFKNPDGTYSGFDVDVAIYVAEKLGFTADKIDWVEATSKVRETLLENHQVDLIFATYSITDARKEKVEFAGPYFVAGQDLLVRGDDTRFTGPESLNSSDYKLCSVTGSTPAQKIKDSYAKDVELVEVTGYGECVTALLAGRVDAVTTDDIILAGLAAAGVQ